MLTIVLVRDAFVVSRSDAVTNAIPAAAHAGAVR